MRHETQSMAASTDKLDSKELSSVQSLSIKHVKTTITEESMATPVDDTWKMCQGESSNPRHTC